MRCADVRAGDNNRSTDALVGIHNSKPGHDIRNSVGIVHNNKSGHNIVIILDDKPIITGIVDFHDFIRDINVYVYVYECNNSRCDDAVLGCSTI
jgi:hypothetical protein